MRVVRLVGKEKIRVEEAPDPVLQNSTDAIVRVTHSAICGADLMPFHGYSPGFEDGTIMGHEFVGEVVDIGDRVSRVSVGERVVNVSMISDGTCSHCRENRATQCDSRALFGFSGVYPRLDGGQADLVRIPLADRSLWKLPDSVSNEDGVFVADILPTGFAAVQRGGVAKGDLVVVLGCGPVGLMAVLSAMGTARQVIAVDSIPVRRELAEQLGATSVSPEDSREYIMQISSGLGADVVVEAAGSISALNSSFGLVRGQGVVSVVGAHFEPDYPLNNAVMFEKEITLKFSIGNPGRDRERLLAAIQSGAMTPSKALTHTLSIEDAADAYRAFDAREMTKVVLLT